MIAYQEAHENNNIFCAVPHAPAQDIVVKGYEDVTTHLMLLFLLIRKTHQLDAVIPHLTHLAHEDTLIILAQNGYGQLEHIPFKNICQAVVYIVVKRKAMYTHFRDLSISIKDNALTQQFRDLVQDSQIDIVFRANIQQLLV